MNTTAQLCDKIVATTYDLLTPEAIAAARFLVLDGIAIALAGTEEEAVQILAAHYQCDGRARRCDRAGPGLPHRPHAGRGAERRLDARAGFRADVDAVQPRPVHHAAGDPGVGGNPAGQRARSDHRAGEGHRDSGLDPSRRPSSTKPAGCIFIRPGWWGRWGPRWRRATCWGSTRRRWRTRSAWRRRAAAPWRRISAP